KTTGERCDGFRRGTRGGFSDAFRQNCPAVTYAPQAGTIVGVMDNVASSGMPDDVLIVEDDAIIALDFEDTILGFGVKTVRTAGNVSRALHLIAERAPAFALLDIGLVKEKSFAIAER